MKKFMDEFKAFISRGNVMNLAVGVIIGGAFQAIINSLVNDCIMPVLSAITGGVSFDNWYIVMGSGEEPPVFHYGNLITAIINFILMALVIFILVKAVNKAAEAAVKKEEEAPAEPTTKKCPFCASEIAIEATRCPHCTSELPTEGAAAAK